MEVDVSWLNVPFRVFGARVASMPWEHLLGLDLYTPSFGNIRGSCKCLEGGRKLCANPCLCCSHGGHVGTH